LGNVIQSMKSDVAAALVSTWTVCDCSVIIQSLNSMFVTAVSFSPWTVCLWLQCHSFHEQSVCDCSVIHSMNSLWLQCHNSVPEQSVCDSSVIQSMNNLFVTAVS